MKFRLNIFILLILTSLTACEVEDFAPAVEEEVIVEETSPQAMSQMLSLVNKLRSEGCNCGSTYMPPVGPVSWNDNLAQAALRHAYDMKDNDFFDHIGSDGTKVSDRVSEAGYSWQTVGENIAWGYPTIQSVFEGWKDSPGHCRNMMNRNFTHMGIAEVDTYWVQDFARPRGS